MNERNSEREDFNLYQITQHGYGFLANNAGKLIALLTALVAVAVTFADVIFTGFSGVEVTSTLAVMVVASYMIHFSLESAGESYGERCEEYQSALARYKAACARIGATDFSALGRFLCDYSARELRERRARMLLEEGLTEEELSAYMAGGVSRKTKKRALRRVARQRALNLSPADLLSLGGGGGVGDLKSPRLRLWLKLFLGMIPTTVCTVFTVSVALSLKDGLTAETVINGLFKLSTLPIIGFRGYLAGYNHACGDKARWVEGRARLLEEFLAVRGKYAEACEEKRECTAEGGDKP